MAALDDVDIALAAYKAGFRGEELLTAVAIALAESGGDPRAHNTRPPDNSYGLWQINMLGALGPARRSTFGISSNDALFDPATNAKAAWTVSGGGGNFRPWSTYTSGAYRRFLERAQTATEIHDQSAGDIIGGVINKAGGAVYDQVIGALGDLADPFLKGLRRISIIGLAVAGGVALVVAGGWRGVKAGG